MGGERERNTVYTGTFSPLLVLLDKSLDIRRQHVQTTGKTIVLTAN